MSKPEIKIKNARILPWSDTVRVLCGDVAEYPEGHGYGSSLSGQYIRTSAIVSVSEDKTRVETRNSMYIVESWEPDEL